MPALSVYEPAAQGVHDSPFVGAAAARSFCDVPGEHLCSSPSAQSQHAHSVREVWMQRW